MQGHLSEMKPIVSRILMALAGAACLGITVCTSLLHMSFLAATGISTEVADPATTIDRRKEIAQGINNATAIQSQLADVSWWLAVVACLLITYLLFSSFRQPHRNG